MSKIQRASEIAWTYTWSSSQDPEMWHLTRRKRSQFDNLWQIIFYTRAVQAKYLLQQSAAAVFIHSLNLHFFKLLYNQSQCITAGSPDPHHLHTQFLCALQEMPAVLKWTAECHAYLIVRAGCFCWHLHQQPGITRRKNTNCGDCFDVGKII